MLSSARYCGLCPTKNVTAFLLLSLLSVLEGDMMNMDEGPESGNSQALSDRVWTPKCSINALSNEEGHWRSSAVNKKAS